MKNDQQFLHLVLRTDFSLFIRKVFVTLSPGTPYLHNWHIDAIAYVLMLCFQGKITRQAILQPPRTLKSICTSVAYVAWALGHNPALTFICVSYSQDLAADLAYKFRVIVQSEWYQKLFPHVRFPKMTDANCITTQGGGRLATSIGGTLTGRGADIIIIDDPLKAEDAHSEVARNRVLTWYTDTLLSRFNNPATGALILVMQRLHEEDLAGMVTEEWNQLVLPAIATQDQCIPVGEDQVFHWKKGELLHAARLSQAHLDRVKRDIGSLSFSSQYQQAPVPVEGNLVKRAWFQWYTKVPEVKIPRIIQSWDIAGTLNGNYSVCTTWLVIKKDYYVLHVWRDRLLLPEVKRKVVALAKRFNAKSILIEKSGISLHLLEEIKQVHGTPRPIGIVAKGDKVDRLEGVSPMIEAGQVFLPKDALWLDTYLHELLGFPNAKYDDQVDSTSQFLEWIRRRGSYSSPPICGPILFTADGIYPPGRPMPYL